MSKPDLRIVPCPTCKKSVSWNDKSPFRPFCSERCKMIDLGEWADERRRIPGKSAVTDEQGTEFTEELE